MTPESWGKGIACYQAQVKSSSTVGISTALKELPLWGICKFSELVPQLDLTARASVTFIKYTVEAFSKLKAVIGDNV